MGRTVRKRLASAGQHLRNGLETCASLFNRYVYRGPVKRILARTGLDNFLIQSYFRVVSTLERRLADDQTVQKIHLGDRSAAFHVSTPIEHELIDQFSEGRERQILELLLDELQPTDVFYDIGAHIGLYSCFIGRHAPAVDIVCFEPHPLTCDRLEENLVENNVDAVTKPYAVSEENGTTSFMIKRETAGGMGAVSESGTHTIESRTLDAVVRKENIPAPTVIKCDIEGEEWSMIRGATDILEDPRTRLLYLEIHPTGLQRRGESEAELRSRIRQFGFDEIEINQHNGYAEYHLIARRSE